VFAALGFETKNVKALIEELRRIAAAGEVSQVVERRASCADRMVSGAWAGKG
jgi:hypothetical protein